MSYILGIMKTVFANFWTGLAAVLGAVSVYFGWRAKYLEAQREAAEAEAEHSMQRAEMAEKKLEVKDEAIKIDRDIAGADDDELRRRMRDEARRHQ